MIEVEITDEMVINARKKAREMGKLKNSILGGQGSVGGFIGEQIALQVLGGEWKNSYEYDMILPDGRTVDVKTKQRRVKPKPHYTCSVSKFNPNQKCDLYGFVSILKDHSKGWFIGTIPKQDFLEKAELVERGTHDPDNNFNTPASCYNMTIEELQNVQSDGDAVLSECT
jgi:hypothetical protein